MRGSFSQVVRPSNIAVSSACTVTARYASGSGRAAKASAGVSPALIASRTSFNSGEEGAADAPAVWFLLMGVGLQVDGRVSYVNCVVPTGSGLRRHTAV